MDEEKKRNKGISVKQAPRISDSLGEYTHVIKKGFDLCITFEHVEKVIASFTEEQLSRLNVIRVRKGLAPYVYKSNKN